MATSITVQVPEKFVEVLRPLDAVMYAGSCDIEQLMREQLHLLVDELAKITEAFDDLSPEEVRRIGREMVSIADVFEAVA